ncbi:MAG TPA: DUF4097 family beta strand repeat-containing protein [Vicinamibacterales bacterium]|jgi:hypothetical protein|nr:DUF4097 family beta strand repeat-containing protein [Vicinamibacterales bacterium]
MASAKGVRPLFHTSALLAVPLTLALGGCDLSLAHLTGRATEEWTHTYQLAPGGTVRIGNTNGRIEMEAGDGSTVEVRAERIARAVTDDGARELLPRITIREDIKPDRVDIETERMSGVLVGAGFEVRYHVRAPKGASVEASNTNGSVVVTGFSGKVSAQTTNGSVTTKDLAGAVDAHTTNGSVNVDLASVGTGKIALRTTNGGLTLRVPSDAKADVSASWTNGGISVSDVKMEVSERSRRRFEGRMNGGGAAIELHTTNGGIHIRSRGGAVESTTDADRPDGERR